MLFRNVKHIALLFSIVLAMAVFLAKWSPNVFQRFSTRNAPNLVNRFIQQRSNVNYSSKKYVHTANIATCVQMNCMLLCCYCICRRTVPFDRNDGPVLNLRYVLNVINDKFKTNSRLKRSDFEYIWRTIDDLQHSASLSLYQCQLLIRCCGKVYADELPSIRMQHLQKIWTRMRAAGIPLNIFHYNALLHVYFDNQHPFVPLDFLSDLKASGIQPNQ